MLLYSKEIQRQPLSAVELIILIFVQTVIWMVFVLSVEQIRYVLNHQLLGKSSIRSSWRQKMEIRRFPLSELCVSITDCPHSTPQWTTTGNIVIRNQNIKNGMLDLTSPSYTNDEDFRKRLLRATPRAGDIVITREAPMGEVCRIPENLSCCLGQRMVLLKPDYNKVNGDYLLYALMSKEVQFQISWSNGTGTTVSNLRIPHLCQLNIPCPELDYQNKIAAVFSAMNKKMIINRRVNDNFVA